MRNSRSRASADAADNGRAASRYGADGWPAFLGVEADFQRQTPRLRLPYIERHLNAPGGVIHGGILATLLVDTAWLAVALNLPEERSVDALRVVDCQVAFLRAARETDLVAEAAILRQGRSFAFVESTVHDHDGRLLATARVALTLHPGDERAVDLSVAGAGATLAPVDPGVTPMGEALNANMAQRVPGLAITSMGPGQCRIEVADQPQMHDLRGAIAPGIQLLVADNTAVFASFELSGQPGGGSTVDLKLSFCEPAVGEVLVAVGRSVHRTGRLVHHQTRLEGADSGRLKAFGTVTYLL